MTTRPGTFHANCGLSDGDGTVAEPRPWRAASVWTAGLVVFFFASYAFAAWVTYRRQYVPSLVFAWEQRIPFLPWTIMPYWSTDLLYVCSPFLFPTRAGLFTHCRRLLAVQLVSVAIFLAFPLKFTFGRPHVDGLLGTMFYLRTGFDTQFNQSPSLHIGFAVVLWVAYSTQLRGWARWTARGCIVLTSLATLTTYRHHFIDLPTGLWAGLFCMALFPEEGQNQRLFQLAALYLAGATLFAAASWRVGNMSWLILWPVGALVLAGSIWWERSSRCSGDNDSRQ